MLKKIQDQIIVSCQAEGDSPFNNPDALSLFAIAADQGGAGGIRSEGTNKIKKIKEVTKLPIIGLIKRSYNDGSVCITRDRDDIVQLLQVGADMIAVDGTNRFYNGFTGHEFIKFCKTQFSGLTIIADIATIDEALNCINAGADAVSTTLYGYTPETHHKKDTCFDLDYFRALKMAIPVNFPLIAEGRIKDPAIVKNIKSIGAWCVVIGSAITRPVLLTKEFVENYKIR